MIKPWVTITTPDSRVINASLLLGRILIPPSLVHGGLTKIGDFGAIANAMGGDPHMLDKYFPDQSPLCYFPAPELFLGLSILFDLAGVLLVVLGLRTRAISLLLLVYVTVAIAIYHSDIRTWQHAMLFLVNMPLIGGLLVLAGVGGGHWSMDAVLDQCAGKRESAERQA